MIFGTCEIVDQAIHTHNDSYMLANITTISARRPFLGAGLALCGLIAGFCASFADLLYPHELMSAGAAILVLVFLALWLGQLQLLSRDLRGSELGTAIWGSYRHLNILRREIATAVQHRTPQVQS